MNTKLPFGVRFATNGKHKDDMETKHIKVIVDDGKIIKASCRRLPDGQWSVVGWGPSLSVRSTSVDNDPLLDEFIDALLYINNVEPNDLDSGSVYDALVDVIQ